MFILAQMFLQQFKSPLVCEEGGGGEEFESSCLRALVFIGANLDQHFSLALRNRTLEQ